MDGCTGQLNRIAEAPAETYRKPPLKDNIASVDFPRDAMDGETGLSSSIVDRPYNAESARIIRQQLTVVIDHPVPWYAKDARCDEAVAERYPQIEIERSHQRFRFW